MKRPTTFDEILERDSCRWPKKGDRLLKHSHDWDKGVEFDGDAYSRHVHIWSGYMRAGAALVDECQREAVDRHFLVYPILFNYRHGLEVAMKWIIDRYGGNAGVSLGEKSATTAYGRCGSF